MANSWVFGNESGQDNTPLRDDRSHFVLLAIQRTARKSTAASELRPESELQASESQPEAQEFELQV